MKRLIQTTLFTLIFLVHIQVSGQTFSSFYSSLAELSIPYSFSDETHCNTPQVDLISSLQDQDRIYQRFKAVARVDLADGYSFIIIKRIYQDDLDKYFMLLAIDENGQVIKSIPIDVKTNTNNGVDFQITSDKILKVADYNGATAEIVTYAFINGRFLIDQNVETVPRSSLANM